MKVKIKLLSLLNTITKKNALALSDEDDGC